MTFLTKARQQIAMQQEMQPPPAPSRLPRQRFLRTLVLELAPSVLSRFWSCTVILGGKLPAQTHAPQTTKKQQQKAAAEPVQPRQLVPEAIAAQQPASPAPISPANQPPIQGAQG